MKKSSVIKIVSVVCVLIVVVITLFICFFFVNNKIKCKGGLDINKKNNTLIAKNDEIKILQISDTQFASVEEAPKALDVVQQVVNKSNPDMIVLTGDNISDNSTLKTAQHLVKFMDSFKLPWALVFGNHDYNAVVPPKDLSDLYEDSKYCIYKTGSIENSYGNYTYTIERENRSIYSLIFMDSGKTGFDKKHVDWYENEINKQTLSNNNKVVNSMVFFHIPLEELNSAYDLFLEDSSIGSGVKNEAFCVQSTNVGLFNKAVELGSTKAFVYGHDHINNLVLNYNGIKLCYGLKSGRTSYFYDTMQGGNLYTITENNEIKIDRIYI